MFARFSLVFITSYAIVISESAAGCDVNSNTDCNVVQLYQKFAEKLLFESNQTRYVREECKEALKQYRNGLKNLEKSAIKSKNKPGFVLILQ